MWCKRVDMKTGLDGGIHIGQSVIQGKGQFLYRCRTRLTDVISTDADRMPFRNMVTAIGDGIGDQLQVRGRWE